MVKARPGLSEERPFGEPAAGNGMLSRRVFLEGAVVTGAAARSAAAGQETQIWCGVAPAHSPMGKRGATPFPPSTAQRYSAVSSLQQLGPNFLLRKESGAQLIIAFHRAEERTGP